MKKYIVTTFSDGSRVKTPVEHIKKLLVKHIVDTGDLEISEAEKQVKNIADYNIIAYASCIGWNDVDDESSMIVDVKSQVLKAMEWQIAFKVVMTETEIDRFMVQKSEAK